MKKIVCTVIALLCLAVTGQARAQENQPLPRYVWTPPPELAQCVTACAAQVKCEQKPVTCPAGLAARNDGRVKQLESRLAELKQKVAKLEKQVGLLAKRDATLEKQLTEARAETAKVHEELLVKYRLLLKDIVDLGAKDAVLEEKIAEMQGTVTKLNERLDSLESRLSPVQFGPRLGFLWLNSLDGTRYTAMPVGARLTLRMTDLVDLNVDGNLLVSFTKDRPLGSQVRGSVGFNFTDWFKLEGGVSATWAGYNSQLKAKSAFVMGDVTVDFQYKCVYAGASFLIGSEFDRGSPAFAYGTMLNLGLRFP